MYRYIHTCMYMYTYIHIHIYTYMHVYIVNSEDQLYQLYPAIHNKKMRYSGTHTSDTMGQRNMDIETYRHRHIETQIHTNIETWSYQRDRHSNT